MELNEDLTFEEEPVAIVDYQVRQLRSKVIPMVKVLCRSNSVEEHTCNILYFNIRVSW